MRITHDVVLGGALVGGAGTVGRAFGGRQPVRFRSQFRIADVEESLSLGLHSSVREKHNPSSATASG
jgi:hypothetical protein